MARKLDMSKAWNDAVTMLLANRDMVLIVAGVFFLLPGLATSLLIPPPAGLANIPPGAEPDPQVVLGILADWLGQYWWAFALTTLAQTIGVIGLLTLLTDRERPTVGEALGFALRALPTYVAAQLLVGAGFLAVFVVIALIGGLSELVGLVLLLMLGAGTVYVGVKLILITPVIAVEKLRRPAAVLVRSWQLTKGNSLLIVAFVLLITLAFLVIMWVAEMALSLVAILNEEAGFIANALGSSLLSMGLMVVMVAVLAAIHRQLAGVDAGQAGELFA